MTSVRVLVWPPSWCQRYDKQWSHKDRRDVVFFFKAWLLVLFWVRNISTEIMFTISKSCISFSRFQLSWLAGFLWPQPLSGRTQTLASVPFLSLSYQARFVLYWPVYRIASNAIHGSLLLSAAYSLLLLGPPARQPASQQALSLSLSLSPWLRQQWPWLSRSCPPEVLSEAALPPPISLEWGSRHSSLSPHTPGQP